MTRKKKLIFNTVTGIIKQITTVICGFILPRYMLIYYGSSVNGLVSSISHFLGFISLLDMGVGSVIQANLYKPLADKDNEQLSKIVKSSEAFFRKLAFIFIVYIMILCFIFPFKNKENFGVWYTVSLLLIISVSTLAQYLFGMTYQLLLNSDQKSYVPLLMQMLTIIINTIFSVFLMKMGASIHIVKLMAATVFLLRPLGQIIYVHQHYQIDKRIMITEEPIKQKWNGFSQHFAAVVCQNIDIVVLTFFSSLSNISIYQVYFNVTNGVQNIIMTAATGLEALFGNMIAKNENKKLVKAFASVEWLTHAGVTFIFTVAGITIIPFIKVYTRGIEDADYIVPTFAILLVAAYGVQSLRIPYFRIIKAAGHFKQTQNGAYISACLNIIITVTSVFKFGLIGAATGTLVAMFYHTGYFVWYLRKHIINRAAWFFIKYLVTDFIIIAVSWFMTRNFVMNDISYLSWAIFASKVTIVVIVVCIIVNSVLYMKLIRNTFLWIKKRK